MTLDELYERVRYVPFPIFSSEELEQVLSGVRVEFERDVFDSRDIAMMIKSYPIKKVSHLIELFISAAREKYSDHVIAGKFAEVQQIT